MKTNEKTAPISRALSEVWEWKDGVYKDIKDLSFEEKRAYFDNCLKDAVRMLNGNLKTNPDGSYTIEK